MEGRSEDPCYAIVILVLDYGRLLFGKRISAAHFQPTCDNGVAQTSTLLFLHDVSRRTSPGISQESETKFMFQFPI